MPDAKRIGVVGQQNSGKTWLIERLIEASFAQGIHVGVIKHDGHLAATDADDWEKPGSDTARYTEAGAVATVLTGGGRVLSRFRDDRSNDVLYLCQQLELSAQTRGQPLQLILVEGFQKSPLPKVGVAQSPSNLDWLRTRPFTLMKWLVCSPRVASLAAPEWAVYHDTDTDRLVTDLLSDID